MQYKFRIYIFKLKKPKRKRQFPNRSIIQTKILNINLKSQQNFYEENSPPINFLSPPQYFIHHLKKFSKTILHEDFFLLHLLFFSFCKSDTFITIIKDSVILTHESVTQDPKRTTWSGDINW